MLWEVRGIGAALGKQLFVIAWLILQFGFRAMIDRLRNLYPETQRPNQGSRFWVAAWIGLIGALGVWHWILLARTEAAATQLQAMQARWRTVSRQSVQAKEIQPRLEAVLTRAKCLVEDRSATKWTHALRSVVTAAGAEVNLCDIHASAATRSPGACELRIDGRASGRSARVAADRFRETLQAGLQRSSGGKTVITRFDRLDDELDSLPTPRIQGNVAFTITARVGSESGATPQAGGER